MAAELTKKFNEERLTQDQLENAKTAALKATPDKMSDEQLVRLAVLYPSSGFAAVVVARGISNNDIIDAMQTLPESTKSITTPVFTSAVHAENDALRSGNTGPKPEYMPNDRNEEVIKEEIAKRIKEERVKEEAQKEQTAEKKDDSNPGVTPTLTPR